MADAPQVVTPEEGAVQTIATPPDEGPTVESIQAKYDAQNNDYTELQSKYNTLETASKVSPYANEYVERVNKMYLDKVDPVKIAQYTKLQNSDISNIPAMDKIKLKLQYENPRWSAEDINYDIEETFGGVPNRAEHEEAETLSEYEKLISQRESKINRASIEAEDFINNQKTSFEQTSNDVQKEQEASRAALHTEWAPQVANININENLFNMSIDNEAIEGKFDFNWKPDIPAGALQAMQKELLDEVIEAGLPLNQQNLEKQQVKLNGWVEKYFAKEYREAAVIDAIISTRKSGIMKQSTTGPLPTGSTDKSVINPAKKKTKIQPVTKRPGWM